MAITNKLKKLLHRKSFEYCTPLPTNTTAGAFVCSDKYNILPDSLAFAVTSASLIYRYDGDQDAWLGLPASGLAGTFSAGACGEFRALGAMGGAFTQTATGGSTTTIITNDTIVRQLTGCRIRVVAGAGVGYDSTISHNTIGANSVLTVPVSGVAFDATTQYQIFSGSLWMQSAGASSGFGVYDLATNAWTARTATGLTWGTDGVLVSTIGSAGSFATGTATAGASTTLTNAAKTWATNQWANYQIRITAGTGIGQIRTIASNTGTVITVSAAWAVTPDATSVYSIEGNDDYFYLLGNNAVTLYRYSVSANTWSTLSPGAARAGAMATGGTASWIAGVSEWDATTEAPTTFWSGGAGLVRQNGRYIYSFRGGATATLDVYDIAANTWISGVSYGNQFETFGAGSSAFDYNGNIYIQKEATNRLFFFDVGRNVMKSLTTNNQTQGAAVSGRKMFLLYYTDTDTVPFLYTLHHTRAELMRMILI